MQAYQRYGFTQPPWALGNPQTAHTIPVAPHMQHAPEQQHRAPHHSLWGSIARGIGKVYHVAKEATGFVHTAEILGRKV
ncbi:MAG: hypothetical protein ACPGR8_06295 [Limisphaerales bacterium]